MSLTTFGFAESVTSTIIHPPSQRRPSKKVTLVVVLFDCKLETRAIVQMAVVDRLDILGQPRQLSTGDTVISRASLDVAVLAVGGTLAAVDEVEEGRARNGFFPSGHLAAHVQTLTEQ